MNSIRPFAEEDIPQVVALFKKLHPVKENGLSPAEKMQVMKDRFAEIFFRHPWRNETVQSWVCETGGGKIIGFLGATPRKMTIHGRSVLAAVSSHLMVDPESRPGLVGIQLNKTFLSGPQDLSITDGANLPGRKIWEGVGGSTLHLYSLYWSRLLRPSKYVITLGSGKYGLPQSLVSGAGPLSAISDALLTRLLPRRFRLSEPKLVEAELDAETLLQCISQFSANYALRPAYDLPSLNWFLRRAASAKQHGALRKVVLSKEGGPPLGWYLYYLQAGGASEVLQVVARKNSAGEVLDHLFHHAWRHGSTSLSGRVEPILMEALSEKSCYYTIGDPWMLVHSANQSILQAIFQGNAFLTKLEGEWCTSFRF